MNFISKDQIIKNRILTVGEPFEVLSLGGSVNIRKWTGTERAKMLSKLAVIYGQEEITQTQSGTPNVAVNTKDFPALFRMMADIVALSLADEQGNRLFTDSEEDLEIIEGFDADTLQLLFEECAKRNGLINGSVVTEIKN